MAVTRHLPFTRRAFTAIALMIGFYSIVIAFCVGCIAIAWVTNHRNTSDNFDFYRSIWNVPPMVLLVMILPSMSKRPYPGPRLHAKSQSILFERLAKLARLSGQEMPVEVILLHEATAQFGAVGRVTGFRGKWILGLGLPLLTLTTSEFEAVMAHEFGHQYSRDARLILVIKQTRAAVSRMMGIPLPGIGMLFAWFDRMFIRITQEIGQEQELIADRVAGETIGSDMAIDALRATLRMSTVAQDYIFNDVRPIVRAGFIPPLIAGLAEKLSCAKVIARMDKNLEEELARTEPRTDDNHPPLTQRIASLSVLPRCENPDRTPAVSLLKDLPDVERAMIASIMNLEGETLKPITWADTGAAVWTPLWEKIVNAHVAELQGVRLHHLFDAAGGKHETISGNHAWHADIALDHLYLIPDREKNVLGAAFACSLQRAGWIVESGPTHVRFTNGSVQLDPFEIVRQIEAGGLKQEDWQAQIDKFGLDPLMPFGKSEILGATANFVKGKTWAGETN